ncbi:MAG TPA: hypothetical protein VHO25_00020, partial [Polyangiaceae bacterium]|nr:hypothetical protein [Polyangiaceae bacterium]
AGEVKFDASVYKRRVIDELADRNQFNAASLFDSSTGQGFAVDTTLLNQCSAVVSRIVPTAVGTYSIAQEPKNKNARQLSGALCGDIVCEAEGSRLRCSLYDPHGKVTFAGPFALCKPSKTSNTVSCAKALPATLKTWQDAKEIKFEGGYWLWLDSDRALVPDGTFDFLFQEKKYPCRYKLGQTEENQSVHCP